MSEDIKLNIYQRINAVMKDCDYVKKEQAQQGKGVKYDTVIAMIRDLLIKHGIVMVVRQLSMESASGVEGTKQKIYQGHYEMDLVNMDSPNDKVTHSAFAHGMDGGDKATGKAHTYAVKLMLVKGFAIETGEDDESRSEKMDISMLSEDQVTSVISHMVVDFNGGDMSWTDRAIKVLTKYKISQPNQLKSSKFEAFKKDLGL